MKNVDFDLLKLMQEEHDKSGPPFIASENFWDNGRKNFMKRFESEGIDVPEVQWFNEVFSARSPQHQFYHERGKGYRDVCEKMLSHLHQQKAHKILELTKPSNANTVTLKSGKDVSFDYLMSVHTVNVMTKYVPSLLSEPCVVLDLGAGWGRIGHVLMQLNEKLTYCILDLPEIMLVPRHRLQQLFPQKNVIDFHDLQNIESISHEELIEKPSLVFGCTQQLPKFGKRSIDCFVSINSLQEMNIGFRDKYLEILQERTMNSYIMASKKAIHGRHEPYDSYKWPTNWNQVHYAAPESFFWWPEYFEIVHRCMHLTINQDASCNS